jgi:hypothetical protein
MVKLVPECVKCGLPVTDSVEPEVEEHGQVKRGRYINSVWICNDCAKAEEKEQDEKSASSSVIENKNSSNDQYDSIVGVASASDVSPNTPKADESEL